MTSDRSRATSPLRMAGYVAILAAAAFSQSGGLMVADTKFDLVTAPGRFLGRGLELWDPTAAFGQVQNQAYGYAWPMGPFFWAGHLASLPEWAVQRLWWSLLLGLAFVGVVRLAQALGVGTPWTQVAAGFAYVLTPRITSLIGPTSVEIWPMALAPWVLLPLVRGSREGSVRRAAALSALVVATCGGVNAVAVAAVLPLGVVWLLTRTGRRRWRLLAWWTGLTVLATAWWWGPLLFLGEYSPPFLDYIESAAVTTLPTDLTRTLVGVSDWVVYAGGPDYAAGQRLVLTSFLLVDAAAIAALGLAGIAVRTVPHRRFLVLGLVTGLVLVGLGWTGELSGWFAEQRFQALDGALAPLRNLHKFDVVLRLPLVLGLAHLLAVLPSLLPGPQSRLTVRTVRVAAVLALVALATPWAGNVIAPRGGVAEVPPSWGEVADYLADHQDGTVALELPASDFGVYTWGNTHDDVLHGLATSPWAVRNVVPLANPGTVAMLDEVTRMVEARRPDDRLAPMLAAQGVGRLVVRNDLDRLETGAPDPVHLRSVLIGSPGIRLVRGFGPEVGQDPVTELDDGTRVVAGGGGARRMRSVEVYQVDARSAALVQERPTAVAGAPGMPVGPTDEPFGAVPRPFVGDVDVAQVPRIVLTDTLRRQEKNFARVRHNTSATLDRDDPWRLPGPEHRHRFASDQDDWEAVEAWTGGVGDVSASSSQAWADAPAPLAPGRHPGAAVDGDVATSWSSVAGREAAGQWWQADFDRRREVTSLQVALAPDSAPVGTLEIQAGARTQRVTAPAPGDDAEYDLDLPAAFSLRVAAVDGGPGPFALAEVAMDGVEPQRWLALTAPPEDSRVLGVALARDPGASACVETGPVLSCDPALAAPGEDGDTLARDVALRYPFGGEVEATASMRRSVDAGEVLLATADVGVEAPTSTGTDVAAGPAAVVDDDPATTWAAPAGEERPELEVELPGPVRLRTLTLAVTDAAPVSAPRRIRVSAGSWSETVTVDDDGEVTLPGDAPRNRRFAVEVLETDPAFTTGERELPPGVSELRVNGSSPTGWADGEPLSLPCGSGPDLDLAGSRVSTSVEARSRDLLRGRSVPLRLCGRDQLRLPAGASRLLATPSDAVRVDTLVLAAPGAGVAETAGVPLRTTGDAAPDRVEVDAADPARLLTLPQNANDAWRATLDGTELEPQRVDGWRQGWWVPAGQGGEVRFDLGPGPAFQRTLLAGAAGVLACLVLLVLPARRSGEEDRNGDEGEVGVLDLAVTLGAGGLLLGWTGLAAAAAGWAVALAVAAGRGPGRALAPGLPLVAATAMLGASLSISFEPVRGGAWASEWGQLAAFLAVVAIVAATPVTVPRVGVHRSRPR